MGVWFWVGFWGLRSFLHHLPFFPSFNDDLGTMPTRRPRSWKKGFAACMSCRQLQIVDLSQTDVLEILGSTFAHCSQLQQLCLPRMLRTIEQEAFYKCTSLKEVSTPPSLLYIARHAFAGCTHLRIILKQGKSSTWRGTYAQSNAFDKCEHFDKPTWLRVLPNDANDLWREDYLDPASTKLCLRGRREASAT